MSIVWFQMLAVKACVCIVCLDTTFGNLKRFEYFLSVYLLKTLVLA